jgi:hypothetical protein
VRSRVALPLPRACEPVYNTKMQKYTVNGKRRKSARTGKYRPVPVPPRLPPRRCVPRDNDKTNDCERRQHGSRAPRRRRAGSGTGQTGNIVRRCRQVYLSVSVRYKKMPLRRNPGVSVQFSVERVVTLDSSYVFFISNHDGRCLMHDAQNGNAT